MKVLDADTTKPPGSAPSFSLGNKLFRVGFAIAWLLLARWTPPPLHAWRAFVLRRFGARLGPGVRIHASVRIWYPPNLKVGTGALVGPGVNLYNQGRITIGDGVIVSQGAHLCASSHDIADPHFQLIVRPIVLEDRCWVAAEAFVGPGVRIGKGAVLAARGALFEDAQEWGVYRGNPALLIKRRVIRAARDEETLA